MSPLWARGFGSVVNTRLPTQGLRVRSPLTPTKITKRRYVLVLPRNNAPVYQCFTLGTLKNLVCHVWCKQTQYNFFTFERLESEPTTTFYCANYVPYESVIFQAYLLNFLLSWGKSKRFFSWKYKIVTIYIFVCTYVHGYKQNYT